MVEMIGKSMEYVQIRFMVVREDETWIGKIFEVVDQIIQENVKKGTIKE